MPRRSAFHFAGIIAVAATISLVGASCAVGPSDRPAVAHDGNAGSANPATTSATAPPIPGLHEARPKLYFSDCTEQINKKLGSPSAWKFGCARLTGTLDSPTRPGRGTILLNVVRVGNGKYPLVVLNDVTGEPSTLYAARLAAHLPKEFLDTFHLIGMDRRGTGDAESIRCIPRSTRENLVGFDPGITDQAGLTRLLDITRDAAQECAYDLDDQLGAFDTWRAAQDLNTLREALAVPTINAIGRGEGARVLTVFAERFGTSVGRFVLDGVLDPTVDAVGLAEAKAAGAQETLTSFVQDCQARGCALGNDPVHAINAVLAKVRQQPVRTARLSFQPGTVLRAVVAGLADRNRWAELADALSKAQNNDFAGLESFLTPLWSGTEPGIPRIDSGLTITCNDTTTRVDPARASTLTADWVTKYPMFGAMAAQELVWCMPWPVPGQPLPIPRAASAPPMLVIGTAADPLTPLPGTTKAAEALTWRVQINWQGAGHGALGQSDCINNAAKTYLIDGKTPPNGTICPP